MVSSEEDVQKEKKVLLMLSGGRDSFLSACRLIEQGNHIYMVTYDNGCMSNADAARKVSKRIIEKYGASRASFIGVRSMSTNLFRLQEAYLYKTIAESSKMYPNLRPAQLPCLACHTGMYIESIVYCKTHNIHFMAEGARKTQKFVVELPEMIERYRELVKENGIELMLPVYELKDDWERKLELADRGYIPKTLEPQCWIGCPLGQELSSSEVNSLTAYYDNDMKPKLQKLIDDKVIMHEHEENNLWEDYQEGYNEISN